MTRRVVILGGTGYLGSRLAAALTADGLEVAVLKRSTSSLERLAGAGVAALFDLEPGGVAAAVSWRGGVDAVVNAAGSYGRGAETSADLVEANTRVPLGLLDAALAAGVGLFVNAGTALDPALNGYALSKRQFSEWGRLLATGSPLRFVDVGIEHFYGPGDDEVKFATHATRSLLAGTRTYGLTPGEQERDFIYIDDVVAAFVTLLEHGGRAFSPGYERVGLGSGVPVTVRCFVELVRDVSGSATRLEFGALPYRPHEVMHSCADTARLRSLGWAPAVPLEEGVGRLVAAERALREARSDARS